MTSGDSFQPSPIKAWCFFTVIIIPLALTQHLRFHVKMFSKHFILALLVAYSSNFVSTHIVTSVHSDLAFLTCIDSLTNMVQNTLCPVYGQMGQYSMEQILNPVMESREVDSRIWEFRNNMKRCCSRPCTIPELVAIC